MNIIIVTSGFWWENLRERGQLEDLDFLKLKDATPLYFNIEVYVFTSITQQNSLKYHNILF